MCGDEPENCNQRMRGNERIWFLGKREGHWTDRKDFLKGEVLKVSFIGVGSKA